MINDEEFSKASKIVSVLHGDRARAQGRIYGRGGRWKWAHRLTQPGIVLCLLPAMWMLLAADENRARAAETQNRGVAAEARLVEEIRRMYGEARLKLERKDYPAAHAGFFDCLALCQAATEHLEDPRQIAGIHQGCIEHLETLKAAERKEEIRGGWKQRLAALEMPDFRVREAELGPVLEFLRRKIGTLAGGEPPDFTLHFAPALRQRKVTLDVQRLPASEVLEMLARMAGLEVRYQQFTILLTEAPVVKP